MRTLIERQKQAAVIHNKIDLMRQHLADDCGTVALGPTKGYDGSEYLDVLINLCDLEGGECSVCSRIICPSGDEMHFHHDGCPSCQIT